MHFHYRQNQLCAEELPLQNIAQAYGTPCYVYSRAAIENHWQALDKAFGDHPHLICYAVKANSNLAVLNLLAKLGSGFDIVSGGELHRVLVAGGDPNKVVFSGVAKSEADIEMALTCGNNGVRCLNIESLPELERIQRVAEKLGRNANIGIRVNPDVDARTHPYIATGLESSKFGLNIESAITAYKRALSMSHIRIHSMACHIGSQITELAPFADAVERVAQLVLRLQALGIELQQLDLGGGLGIDYAGEVVPSAASYVDNLLAVLSKHGVNLPVAIEPGRSIIGTAGVLLTKVEYLKETPNKSFAVIDAGMNDLLRPSLYQAFHKIKPVLERNSPKKSWDVVGPVCESADVLGQARELALQEGDLLSIMSAGAYAFTMASNYNSRPRPPEVLVDGDQHFLIRQRETLDELVKGEQIIPA